MKKEYIRPSTLVYENMLEPVLQGESRWGVDGNNQLIKDDEGDEDDGFVIDAKAGIWDDDEEEVDDIWL